MRLIIKNPDTPIGYGAMEEALSISVQNGGDDIAWLSTNPTFVHILTDTPISAVNEDYLSSVHVPIVRSACFHCSAVTHPPVSLLRFNKTLNGHPPSGETFTSGEAELLQSNLWRSVLDALGVKYEVDNMWSLVTPNERKRIIAYVFDTSSGVFLSTSTIRLGELELDEEQVKAQPLTCSTPIGYDDIFTSLKITFEDIGKAIQQYLQNIYGEELIIVEDFTETEKTLANSLLVKHQDYEWIAYGRRISTT